MTINPKSTEPVGLVGVRGEVGVMAMCPKTKSTPIEDNRMRRVGRERMRLDSGTLGRLRVESAAESNRLERPVTMGDIVRRALAEYWKRREAGVLCVLDPEEESMSKLGSGKLRLGSQTVARLRVESAKETNRARRLVTMGDIVRRALAEHWKHQENGGSNDKVR